MPKLLVIPVDQRESLYYIDSPDSSSDPDGSHRTSIFRQIVGGSFQGAFLRDNIWFYCNDTLRLFQKANYVNVRMNEFFGIEERYHILGNVILFTYNIQGNGDEYEVPSNIISELTEKYGAIESA
jgi:hypothetical protein